MNNKTGTETCGRPDNTDNDNVNELLLSVLPRVKGLIRPNKKGGGVGGIK